MPCEYSQAQHDDFQWEQVRIHPGARAPADLPHGESTLGRHSPFVSFCCVTVGSFLTLWASSALAFVMTYVTLWTWSSLDTA